jgi:hypothetical protein
LVIYLIIAWRILHLVTWGRDCPNLPCDVVFDPEEWQAAWIVGPPHQTAGNAPTLGPDGAADRRLWGLSGAQTRRSSRPQSPLGRLQKVRAFAIAFEAGRAVYAGTDKLWVNGFVCYTLGPFDQGGSERLREFQFPRG